MAPMPVLPSALTSASAPGESSFRGSMAGLCMPLPTLRRFLAEAAARLGGDADRYSFIVADLHRLLFAGFTGAPSIRMRLRRVWAEGGRAEPDRRRPTHGGAFL